MMPQSEHFPCSPRNEKQSRPVWVWVIMLVVAVLVLVGGISGWRLVAQRHSTVEQISTNVSTDKVPSDADGSSPNSLADNGSKPKLDNQQFSALVKKQTTAHPKGQVGVSVMLLGTMGQLDTNHIYGDTNAEYAMRAYGLYIPVYLMAHNSGCVQTPAKGSPLDDCWGDEESQRLTDDMMRNMDPVAGNAAIDRMGGIAKVNDWMITMYGDKNSFMSKLTSPEESVRQISNHTWSSNAVIMLQSVDERAGADLMNADLTGLGVRIPDGMIVHAQYGKADGSYNVYAIVEDSTYRAAVSVMTESIGDDDASELITETLAELHRQLGALHE